MTQTVTSIYRYRAEMAMKIARLKDGWPQMYSLDDWEIPRDRIVLNRLATLSACFLPLLWAGLAYHSRSLPVD